MQAIVVYVPHDERGEEILDELERRTEHRSTASDYAPNARQYWVTGAEAHVHAFEPMLDGIDPDWAEHVTSPTPG